MNRLHKNRSGFGLVETIIILAVIILLGGAGWFVLHRNGSTTTYKNAEYGFQFEYPKAWGQPTASTIDGMSGKQYQLSWPGKARAGFSTKDYKPDTTGKVIHAQISLSCDNKDSQYVVWLYFDASSCTSAAIFALPNKNITQSELIATKKFAATSKLESIIFAFDFKKNSAGISGKSELQKLYSDAQRQSAISLAKSIK